MKILADTSVWSLSLRRRKTAVLSAEEKRLTESLAQAIRDGRVAMIGPIRQEILSGIKEQAQFDKLRNLLQSFPDESLETIDYEQAALAYNLCRSNGFECGPIDMLICAVAIRRNWQILANDAALNKCMAMIAAQQP